MNLEKGAHSPSCLMATVPPLHNEPESQHPRFFIRQCERLSVLLAVVVAESNVASDPDACIDYLQLSDILIDLLDQAQLYSVLPSHELRTRTQEVSSFVSKIQTVEEAVADWDVRTGIIPNTGVSKKRARSVDFEEETAGALKRRRGTGSERDLVADAVHTGLRSNILPPIIEDGPTHWWTEPFCD